MSAQIEAYQLRGRRDRLPAHRCIHVSAHGEDALKDVQTYLELELGVGHKRSR